MYFCHYFSFYHFSAILKKILIVIDFDIKKQQVNRSQFFFLLNSDRKEFCKEHIYHQDFSGSNYILGVDFCSEKERQQWLIALGSAKANQANRQRRQRISSTTSSSFGDSPNQAIPQLNRSNSTNSIGTSLLDNALTIGT